jgi:hypothetical protein
MPDLYALSMGELWQFGLPYNGLCGTAPFERLRMLIDLTQHKLQLSY